MEMLCLMHDADPRGSLVVNGRQVTSAELAALSGCFPKDAGRLLAELEGAGVFSRDPDGIIYSRRMRSDTLKAERDRQNGKGGGNPFLRKVDNGGVNPDDKAQKPEARSQSLGVTGMVSDLGVPGSEIGVFSRIKGLVS